MSASISLCWSPADGRGEKERGGSIDGGCDVKTAGPTRPFGAGMTGPDLGRAGMKLSGKSGGVSETAGPGLQDADWDREPAQAPLGEKTSEGEGMVAGVEMALKAPTDRFEGVKEASSKGDDASDPLSRALLSSSTCAILDFSEGRLLVFVIGLSLSEEFLCKDSAVNGARKMGGSEVGKSN